MTSKANSVPVPAQAVHQLIAAASAPGTAGPAENDFNAVALQLFAWQFARNEPYQALCRARKQTPETVKSWSEIPAVPTGSFKEFAFTCLPPDERTTVFHSSGTTRQQPSRHFHNEASLALYHASLRPWFARHLMPGGIPQPNRPHLLSLTPPPAEAPHSSLVHMLEDARQECGGLDSCFAGTAGPDNAWAVDAEKTAAWLNRQTVINEPVIVAGTAFNFVHLIDWLISRDVRFRLPPGSSVMETGGYKARSRALPRAELHALMVDRLGLPASRIVCEYGMCELSSQAYDHVTGDEPEPRRFRFPPWARVRVMSSESGREVPEGRAGLLQICDLANAFSVLSVQTEDLAIRQADGFELIGRAEAAEPRGCSLMAADAVRTAR